ncbi:MAG: guanylate kinase [Bacilli bacterium]|nr:guanylate kinase [Bacilli bacterium]MBQ4255742.1 guanylate kinase [Bacilli bacterium]
MEKRGKLIILSGPSGVGKGTVRLALMKRPELNLCYSVSMTTRGMRAGEVDGKDYIFVTREKFEEEIKKGNLLEWNEFVGNFYGTPLPAVEKMRNEGKNVLLEIDVNGQSRVVKKCPDAVTIFLLPPNLEVLEARIRGRKTEPEEIIKERLDKANAELGLAWKYQYRVYNDDVERAADEIASIILK